MQLSKKRITNLLLFAYASFLFCWVCNWMWFVVERAVNQQLSWTKVEKTLIIADYMHFYRAGKMILSEDRAHLYESDWQFKWLKKLVYPHDVPINMDNQNVPYFLVWMALFALLPINASQIVFMFLSFGVGTFCLFLLWKERSNSIDKKMVLNFALLVIGALASFAGFQTFFSGQTTWWVLATISMFFLYYWRGKDIKAGFFLATLIKIQYLPFLIIIPLAQKRFRTILAFAVTVLVFLIASACVLGPETVINYPRYFFKVEGSLDVGAPRMICLRALLYHLFPSSVALAIAFTLTILAMAGLFVIWFKAKGKDHNYFAFSVAITLLVALIVAPHCFAMDTVLLLIACVLTLPNLITAELGAIQPLALRIYTCLFMAYPVLTWPIFLISHEQMPVNCVSYQIIHTVLLVCAARCLKLNGKSDTTT